MQFQGFLGNHEIKAALSAAFQKNRLPHAIILQGEDGLGKRTLARLIARAAVCLREDGPCGVCPSCIRSLAGSHPDIRIEEGSGKTGAISVETIRELTEDAYRKPEEADCNVYLIFVKSRLSEPAQNKLLKVIEEPPGSALFIITIASAESLLLTIRSRAQIFSLKPVPPEEAAVYLQEKDGVSAEQARESARLQGGNIGRMIGGNAEAAQIAEKMAGLLDGRDEDEFLAAAWPLTKNRDLFCETARLLGIIFRDACIARAGGREMTGICPQISERLAFSQRQQNLMKLPDICRDYVGLSERNINMNLLVTAFCAKIRKTVLK